MEINPLYILVFFPGLLLGFLGGIVYRHLYFKYLDVGYKENLTGREIAGILTRGESLTLILAETIKPLENYLSGDVLTLDTRVINRSSITSLATVLDEVTGQIQNTESVLAKYIKDLSKILVTIFSAFSFGILLLSLIFVITDLYYLSIIIQGICLVIAFLMSVVEFDRGLRAIEIGYKYSLLEKYERDLVANILKFRTLIYFELMVLTPLKIMYYIFDTFKK